ncbi:MAG: 2-succinylbenzoate--CoA ligase [Deltaproteobacteria bacterium]|nr:MAG: 2-succinylbenzoate--CoA ligase [Deltaproteobacteria bacterium]
MSRWIQEHALARPQALALTTEAGDVLTYADLCEAAARWAAVLAGRGIGPGDRVAIRAPNHLRWVLAAHAIWWRGATLVPLHPRATRPELDRLRDHVPLDAELDASDLQGLHERARTAPPLAPPLLDDEAVLTVLFTSGSSGIPRAVPHTLAHHRASALASSQRLGRDPRDRWLCCLPLCHTGGLAIVLRSALYGTAVHLMPVFEPDRVFERLRRTPLTLASFVPTMLRRLLDRPPPAIEHTLRAVLIGGGPIDPAELVRAREAGLPVVPTYGMTEAASQITTLHPAAPIEDMTTVGHPLPGVELRIVDGEIRVRGPMLTPGYLNAPTPRDEAGFFRTGDRGSLRDDGALFLSYRGSDLILTGGENVTPLEVEATLRRAPMIADAAVFGLEDPEWGEVVAAAVVPRPRPPSDTLISSLEDHCRASLAAYKVPRRWFLLDELPLTPTGKVHRRALRERFSEPPRRSQP